MIAYVSGEVLEKGHNYLIVLRDGVGYKVTIGNFPPHSKGSIVKFYCYNHVREDANELFGFKDFNDLEFFEMLLGVSGVGPKVAQTIIVNLEREKIKKAIETNDINLFKSVPGIGTKVAAKIIVELKNKVSKDSLDLADLEDDETVDALLALGLKKNEILPVLKKIPPELEDVQSKIKFVLKHVAGK